MIRGFMRMLHGLFSPPRVKRQDEVSAVDEAQMTGDLRDAIQKMQSSSRVVGLRAERNADAERRNREELRIRELSDDALELIREGRRKGAA